MEGVDGAQQIKQIMKNFRENPPIKIGAYSVVKIRDYEASKIMNVKTGEEKEINLPKSNVLYYELENDAWICIRPSGTEPKIKFYIGVKGSSFEDAKEKLEILKKNVTEM